jgi:1-acyl-sn-glycerol-3-phosphate acyltransferase
VRLGLLIFCRKIIFTNRNILKEKGPLLLACNHPNSFFDALLLGAFFKHPIHFLARGDAFKHPVAKKLLTALNAIPIYRLKEGKEYLALNDNTFDRCLQILKQGGIVLIFTEGLCINQWEIRPLKKGSARIAISAWKSPSVSKQFRILPVSFNYSSFTHFSKNVIIEAGKPILKQHLPEIYNEAEQIAELNRLIYTALNEAMLTEKNNVSLVQFLLSNPDINKGSYSNIIAGLKKIQRSFYTSGNENIFNRFTGSKKVSLNTGSLSVNMSAGLLLLIPAIVALVVHLPVYLPVKMIVRKKTNNTVFYHSVLFGALIIIYPLYVIILSMLCFVIFKNPQLLSLIILLPLLALIFLQWKDCVVSVYNYFRLTQKERKELKRVISRMELC